MPTLLLRFLPYIIAAVAIIGLGWWLHHSGYESGKSDTEARTAKLVAEANAKTEAAERGARKITEDHAREIESLRIERQAEIDRARTALRPVRLCKPARLDGELPGAASAAASTDGADTADGVLVPAGRDIGPELVSLAASCQRDHDTAVAWQRWYAQQAALVQPNR